MFKAMDKKIFRILRQFFCLYEPAQEKMVLIAYAWMKVLKLKNAEI